MKLKGKNKKIIDEAAKVLERHGLVESSDYAFGVSESIDLRETGELDDGSTVELKVTFPAVAAAIKELEKLNWVKDKTYVNNGSPAFFCSDLHNDQSGLRELIQAHGKEVKMIRMKRL